MSELRMTKEKVATLLKENGLKRNSQSWFDYEKAKKLIFKGKWLKDHNEYDQIIDWIGDYFDI